MRGSMVAVFEPEIIEVVGEPGKATIRVHPFISGGGIRVRDVLESTLDIKAEVIVDQEFESSSELRGKFPIATDGFLVRPVAGVGIDHTCAPLDIRDNDPVGLDEIVSDEAGDAGHVGTESFPDIGSGDFEESFEISAERGVAEGVFLVIRGDKHPAEPDIVLLVVEDGFVRTKAAGREHHAGHVFESDAVFDKEGRGEVAGVGHGGKAGGCIGRRQSRVRFGGRLARLLHLGEGGTSQKNYGKTGKNYLKRPVEPSCVSELHPIYLGKRLLLVKVLLQDDAGR